MELVFEILGFLALILVLAIGIVIALALIFSSSTRHRPATRSGATIR